MYPLNLLTVPFMSLLNRFRGGGILAVLPTPVHRRYLATGATVLLLLPVTTVGVALAWGLTWLAWSIPAWGRYYTLGRIDRTISSGSPNWWESWIEQSGKNDYWLFTFRNTFCLLPMALFFGWSMLLLGPLQTAAYEAGWRIADYRNERGGTGYGEWITGALHGVALCVILEGWLYEYPGMTPIGNAITQLCASMGTWIYGGFVELFGSISTFLA